jgi:hypothetical protein
MLISEFFKKGFKPPQYQEHQRQSGAMIPSSWNNFSGWVLSTTDFGFP